MIYAILIYVDEAIDELMSDEERAIVLQKHRELQSQWSAKNGLLATAKLMTSSTAITVKGEEPQDTIDGPFAESKEQFIGFYLLDCVDLDDAIKATRILPTDHHRYEIRPADWIGGKVAE